MCHQASHFPAPVAAGVPAGRLKQGNQLVTKKLFLTVKSALDSPFSVRAFGGK